MKILLLAIAFLMALSTPLLAEEGQEVELIRQGTAFLEKQDYQKAAQAFREAVRVNPANAEAHKGMGMAYMKIGYSDSATNVEVVENAVAAFKEALRLAPGSAQTRYHLAVAYLVLYDKKGALEEYEALRDLDKGMAEDIRSRIEAYRQPKSFGKVVTQVGAATTTSTRITMAGNHVLVPVTLSHNDKSVETTLVLDTGASSTLITNEVARRLNINLRRAGMAKLQVADGRVAHAWHVKLDKVTVGPKSKSDLDVVIIQSGKDFPFEGLLGMDFLRNFKHSIDFSNQVINWAP